MPAPNLQPLAARASAAAAVGLAALAGIAALAVNRSDRVRSLIGLPLRAKHTGQELTKEQAADVLKGVPIIDISPLLKSPADDAAVKEVVRQIKSACEKWGFFQIVNHGVPQQEIDAFEKISRAFFALPTEKKKAIKRTKGNARGWYDDELTKQARDWKQGFDYGRPGAATKHVDGQNLWPADFPEFRTRAESYFETMERLAAVLMRAIAMALGLDASAFEAPFKDHTSFLRLNYYPVCPQPEKHFSVGRHSDAGSLTILKQDDDGPASLQVRLRHTDRWVSIPPVRGAYVINIGDMTQVWSNGRFYAAEHRVKANESQERYSAPFFYNPGYGVDVAPLGLTPADEPRYKPINWGDYRRKRYAGDYANYGEEVQIDHYSTGRAPQPAQGA
eukprot:tig00000113_g5638.t1